MVEVVWFVLEKGELKVIFFEKLIVIVLSVAVDWSRLPIVQLEEEDSTFLSVISSFVAENCVLSDCKFSNDAKDEF